jgi:hypothetical protein
VQKFTQGNDFSGLVALLRNFFSPSVSSQDLVPRRPKACRELVEGACLERTRFAERNQAFRNKGRKPLESLGAKLGNFAGSFVFNVLSSISFRSFLASGEGGCFKRDGSTRAA